MAFIANSTKVSVLGLDVGLSGLGLGLLCGLGLVMCLALSLALHVQMRFFQNTAYYLIHWLVKCNLCLHDV